MVETANGDDTTWPPLTGEERDYWLSEEGIAEMMRALSDQCENWRRCPVKRCRRARCCQGPDMICQLKEPSRTAPREDIAAIHARMRQIVLRRLERQGIW